MSTLSEIKSYINPKTLIFNPPEDFVTRSTEEYIEYDKHKDDILSEWSSFESYLEYTFLGYSRYKNNEGFYFTAWRPGLPTKALTLNPFPYTTIQGYDKDNSKTKFISLILWIGEKEANNFSMKKENILRDIKNLLDITQEIDFDKTKLDFENVIIFENSDKNKSVKKFKHLHIIFPLLS